MFRATPMLRAAQRSPGPAGRRAGSPRSRRAASAASATVRAIGPPCPGCGRSARSPSRSPSPTVGLIPTMPLRDDGQMIEPSVSVPTATAHRSAATATPEPELEPQGLRSSAYGLRHWPPRALHPLEDAGGAEVRPLGEVGLAQQHGAAVAEPRDDGASFAGRESTSASEPAVVLMPSAVSMLSFTMTGMPWSGPRTWPCAPLPVQRVRDHERVGVHFDHRTQVGPDAVDRVDPCEVGLGEPAGGELARVEPRRQVGDVAPSNSKGGTTSIGTDASPSGCRGVPEDGGRQFTGIIDLLAVDEQLDTELPDTAERSGLLRPPHDRVRLELFGDQLRVLPRELTEVHGSDVARYLRQSWHAGMLPSPQRLHFETS